MNATEDLKKIQTILAVDADGVYGPQTKAALDALVVAVKAQRQGAAPMDRRDSEGVVEGKGGAASPKAAAGAVDARSEGVIATLNPRVREVARALVRAAADEGIVIQVISGTRSYAEQDALYAKGRTKAGAKVTNAAAGYSNHNFGIAFDVGIFDGGKYLEESARYRVVGQLGKALGLDWGGDWKSIVDEPHFELRPAWAVGWTESRMLAELRRRKAAGEDAFA